MTNYKISVKSVAGTKGKTVNFVNFSSIQNSVQNTSKWFETKWNYILSWKQCIWLDNVILWRFSKFQEIQQRGITFIQLQYITHLLALNWSVKLARLNWSRYVSVLKSQNSWQKTYQNCNSVFLTNQMGKLKIIIKFYITYGAMIPGYFTTTFYFFYIFQAYYVTTIT